MSLYFPSVYTTPTKAGVSQYPTFGQTSPLASSALLGASAGMAGLTLPTLAPLDASDPYGVLTGASVGAAAGSSLGAAPLAGPPAPGGGGGVGSVPTADPTAAGAAVAAALPAFDLSQVGDYMSDPMLAQVRAYNDAAIAAASARSLEQQRQSLLGFGDVNLATQVLGSGDATVGAVSADPNTSLSVLARIARNYNDTTHNANEALNQANLFYSGYRVKSLADLAHADEAQVYDATQKERNVLQGITDALLGVKDTARQRELSAISDAYNRALEIALANWQARQAAAAAAAAGGGGGTRAPGTTNPDGSITTPTGEILVPVPYTSGDTTSYYAYSPSGTFLGTDTGSGLGAQFITPSGEVAA